jgi:FlaG/FlaF family flagellin (archaellin)
MRFSSHRDDAVSPVIAIILMVAITVVLASVLYVWVMNIADTDEGIEQFPTLEITIMDLPSGDELKFKQTSGDPLDWSKYKIIIANQSDDLDTAVMLTLSGIMVPGETITFNATNASGFSDIDYRYNTFYNLEIYNIRDNKRVFYKNNIICTTEI